jgi:dihydrofolate reductase
MLNEKVPVSDYDIICLMKTIVIAYDENHGIGADNDLLWRNDLPADLQHFKDVTIGQTVIMGYQTYKSIGRPLTGRQNIVISHNKEIIIGFDVVESLGAAFDSALPGKEIFIIGGGKIYAKSINSVDRILATEVNESLTKLRYSRLKLNLIIGSR